MHERTCAGPPGACVPVGSRSAWIESTARRNGRAARAASRSAGELAPRRRRRRAEPSMPRRRAARGDLALATPRRTRAGRGARQPTGSPPTGGEGSTCRCRARLRAGQRWPGRGRRRARDRRRRSRSRSAVRRRPRARACERSIAAGTVPPARSSIVPHAPHPGHRPAHCASCCPHSRHASAVRTLPTPRTLAAGSDSEPPRPVGGEN